MKRAVICVPNPQDYVDQLNDYSIMIVNPLASLSRQKYLFDQSDYSLKITQATVDYQNGQDYQDERLFWYTSGTTGDSKFCSFTQSQLDHLTQTICACYDITANDRYISVMPLWHAHGQGFYWAAKQVGCEVQYAGIGSVKAIEKYSPTFVTAIPDVLKVISNMKLHHLRFIRSASSPLPNALYLQLKRQHAVPVLEAFGMTESLSHCFSNPLHGEQRMGTVGIPSGVDADIVDQQLYIKGASVCDSGWYNTGDLAEQDSAGYYRILGRSVDQLNIRGIKINPHSLEKQLKLSVPNVDDCVVFGSDQVKCLYVGTSDTAAVVEFFISQGIHLRPRLLKKISVIPLSPSGKISRSWLEKQY